MRPRKFTGDQSSGNEGNEENRPQRNFIRNENQDPDNKPEKQDEEFDWRKDIPKREYSVEKNEDKDKPAYPRKQYQKRDGQGGGYNRGDSQGGGYNRGQGGGGYNRNQGGGYNRGQGGGGYNRNQGRGGGYNNRQGGGNFRKPFQKNRPFEVPKAIPLEEQVVRLNRYLANAGICSRREADLLIAGGAVSVNGQVVTQMGVKVNPGDQVRYNGELISTEKRIYILMNKPKDTITTSDDPEERRTVLDLLGDNVNERVYPVGRLDRNTTGVLLITNDGELSQKLTHPSYDIKKVYLAVLDKKLEREHLEMLAAGVKLEDGFIKPDAIDYVDNEDKKHIGIEIHSGRNHIIHRMFEHAGYIVEKLDRVSYAGMTKKDMKRGQWRFLSEQEVGHLRRITSRKKFFNKKRPPFNNNRPASGAGTN